LYQKSDTLYTNSKGYYVTSLLDCGNKYRIMKMKGMVRSKTLAMPLIPKEEKAFLLSPRTISCIFPQMDIQD